MPGPGYYLGRFNNRIGKQMLRPIVRVEIAGRVWYIGRLVQALERLNPKERYTYFMKNSDKILTACQDLLELSW